MKKMVELMISLAAMICVGSQIAGMGAQEGVLYNEINAGLRELGVQTIEFEQAGEDLKQFIKEDEQGNITVEENGLMEYVQELFENTFENPMDELLQNFEI